MRLSSLKVICNKANSQQMLLVRLKFREEKKPCALLTASLSAGNFTLLLTSAEAFRFSKKLGAAGVRYYPVKQTKGLYND